MKLAATKTFGFDRASGSGTAILALAFLAPACTKPSAPVTSETIEAACDPLAPKAITLGGIVGVGKAPDGTLYVDAANGVFISAAGALVRQHVTGSGGSGTNEWIFSFEPPGGGGMGERNLLVETTGATATAMALGPAGSKAFLNEPGSGRTALTIVDPASVAAMSVVNTPNSVAYIGDVANGDVVVATRPINGDGDPSTGGLAIFYGRPDGVLQRTITSFEQTLSNSGTVTFLVFATPYVLAFGMVPTPDAGPFGTFTLQGLTPHGGATMAVNLRASTSIAGLGFWCIQ